VTIRALLNSAQSTLNSIYDDREAKNILRILFMSTLNLDSIQLELKMEDELESDKIKLLNIKIQEVATEKPIQYVINEAEFLQLKLYVNSSVLIPRPETEEMVDLIIQENNILKDKSLNVIDIGTGSGCIALAIKSVQREWNITGIDVSLEALAVAKKNANDLNLDVHFEQFDILKYYPSPDHNQFDIIVSNPPYISDKERDSMKKNVHRYEPHIALFADKEDPLNFYKAILDFGHHYLKEHGKIYVEVNEFLSEDTKQLFLTRGFKNVSIRKDLSGKDRIVVASKIL